MTIKQIEKYEDKQCRDPEHEPPTLIHLEPGKYEHQCPRCGEVKQFEVPLITL